MASWNSAEVSCAEHVDELRNPVPGCHQWLERFEDVVEHLVYALRATQRFLDALIDLARIAVDIEARTRTNGQGSDRFRVITFVRPADLEFTKPQGVHNLGGRCDERNNSHP